MPGMTAKRVEFDIPADIFIALNEPEQQVVSDMRLFAAIRFYETNKLTLGKAARLAGLTRFEFENCLAQWHIPISNLTFDDIERDIRTLQKV